MIHLYNTAVRLIAPAVRAVIALQARQRPLLDRFHPALPVFDAPPVWVHACSVGEVNLAVEFLTALATVVPSRSILLTVSTVTGRARAEAALEGRLPVAWFPFDHPRVVARFFEQLRPRALILVESEFWPNVFREAARRGVPIALVNGRISDKHLRRYHLARPLFSPMFRSLALAAMQNETYAERIAALGAAPAVTHVAGSLKFDAAHSSADPTTTDRLRRESGLASDALVVVFGSTRPGDESLARACWDQLKSRFPKLHFVIAPRHPARINEALAAFSGEHVLQRSAVRDGNADPEGQRVLLVDTLGELASFYALGTVAVIGGSFSEDVQGHNPIEPAALGVPVLFGPHMRNFQDSAALLTASGAALEVAAAGLPAALEHLLTDAGRRRAMSEHAARTVRDQHGAMARTIELLRPILAE